MWVIAISIAMWGQRTQDSRSLDAFLFSDNIREITNWNVPSKLCLWFYERLLGRYDGCIPLFELLPFWISPGLRLRRLRYPVLRFYSGFMCGTVYFQRFVDNKANVYRRLTVRGLKLILLFLLVNLAINALLQRNYNDQALGLHAFFKNIFLFS